MSFVSFKFILFLGLTFFVYFVVPNRFQWMVLLLFSFLYYYLCSGKLIAVLLTVSVFTWLMGLLIDVNEDKQKRKNLSRIGILVVLADLIVFKYADFIIESVNELIHGNLSFLHLMLPLGISYYTLQAISYLTDVSKKKIKAERNVFRFLLYMSYFPQIVQGPIPKYQRLHDQLFEEHDVDYVRITQGLQLMLWGIAKKAILADHLSVPVSYIFDHYDEFHGLFLVFAIICYGFQIYADFSGGIDAIRGISEVFGIELDENFRQPFYSRSVEEFWRRWHISLGAWMREYVFYPLSLSKTLNRLGKKLRNKVGASLSKKIVPFFSMFIVYLLVGIWHGAGWKYVVYGIWNGVFIMNGILFEDQFKKAREKAGIREGSGWWCGFQMLRTFVIVSIGRLISRPKTLTDSIAIFRLIFKNTFDITQFGSEALGSLGINGREWILCLISVIIILSVDHLKEKGIDIRKSIASKNIVLRWAVYLGLIMAMLIFGKYGPGYDAANFIYGNF